MTKQLQQNLIAILIFTAALCFLYFKYLVAPMDKKLKTTEIKVSDIEKKLDTMKRRANDLPKLEHEMKLLKFEVSALEKTLPKEVNVQEILRIVTNESNANSIKIQSFTPLPVTAQPNYNEIPFTITCTGGFHSLARFLAELGQESRILSAQNVSLVSYTSTTKESRATVNASFILKAYTYKQ